MIDRVPAQLVFQEAGARRSICSIFGVGLDSKMVGGIMRQRYHG